QGASGSGTWIIRQPTPTLATTARPSSTQREVERAGAGTGTTICRRSALRSASATSPKNTIPGSGSGARGCRRAPIHGGPRGMNDPGTQTLSTDPLPRRKLGLGLLALAATRCMTQMAAPPAGPDGSPHKGRALPEPTTARKLKILCLHGYHGSARTL